MKTLPTLQKLRGGYYTPDPIAHFLAGWAIQSPESHVLEPSCGDGAILAAAATRLAHLSQQHRVPLGSLLGIEIDAGEASLAAARASAIGNATSVLSLDFFDYAYNLFPAGPLFEKPHARESFDAIVGNPPFIRYQNFPESSRLKAFDLMGRLGLHPSRLTNAWVPFLVVSAALLKPGGRLAMVIPAELLQVGYAAEVRRFLSDHFRRLTLVSFRTLVFEEIQQEVVLLLGERGEVASPGIRVVDIKSTAELAALEPEAGGTKPKSLDHSQDKWTQYFLTQRQIGLLRALRQHPDLKRLGDVASVDVGVVTGDNDFFVLTESQAIAHDLLRYTTPLVSRAAHLPGAILAMKEWNQQLAADQKVLLFTPPSADLAAMPRAVRDYIQLGESIGVHEGYKCRIRPRWFVVPSVWTPDAFFTRQVHLHPRLIWNRAGATATDTIHRVRLTNGTRARELCATFVNSLTLAFSEVSGRSYGGGVLTFEPSEVERLPLPRTGADKIDLDAVDSLLRRGKSDECLDLVDKVLLSDGLGLDSREVKQLRSAYSRLRDRRLERR